MVALSARGLEKRFDSVTAVDGLDLTVHEGTVLALLGPNGAGKTTTVEMCEGFISPDAGTISALGLNPNTQREQLCHRIGVMLQGGGGYPGAQAEEMLRLVAAYSANPLDPEWLLTTLGLDTVRRTSYRRLSGGQQQRLALACALVSRPELVFLDEPTAGLDAQARLLVWDLIRALSRDGVAVLLTTHLMDEAEALADQVQIIDNGRTVALGTPAELTHRGAENEVRFAAPARLRTALLSDVLPEGFHILEPSPGNYLVRGGEGTEVTPQVVSAITGWCLQMNALISDLRVESRSLEDVFLDLTGRDLRDGTGPAPAVGGAPLAAVSGRAKGRRR